MKCTATNTNGDSCSCLFNVVVTDNIEPTAVCQTASVQLDATGDGTIEASAIDNGSNDACGIRGLAASPSTFTCANVGANTVTLTATDNNGNDGTCPATVMVVDDTAPSAVCTAVTVQLDASGQGATTAAAVSADSTDNW